MQLDWRRPRRIILTSTLFASLAAAPASPGAAEMTGSQVQPVFTIELPNVPGKRLTAVVVHYAPGAASTRHHHAGSVYAFVLSGVIRSQNSETGPAKDYKASESFFEPPGSHHLISANASASQPASLLAVLVADDGAVLTVPDE